MKLRPPPSLRHVDLSHNRLDARAARALGHALEANHALRGLHLEGNAGCVDARGEKGLRARARAWVGGMKKL